VTLRVVDEGCGTAEETLRDALQLVATVKTYGTGIGLALVQSLIESEHHGSVRLVSRKGTGTTVTVTLPLEQGKR
jgi:signal transduction histidine kinase